MKPVQTAGEAAVSITAADLSAYMGDGETFVDVNLDGASVTTTVAYSIFDVNKDGVVDQLDLTRAQRYYGTNYADADVNNDRIVDINDLILILNNYHVRFQ